jgi:RNA polymerase sigma-70 factor (ECF subfamily)
MERPQSLILIELLVLQAQSGSRHAMNQLVELWTPKLARRAYRLTQDHEGAHEVVQETWIGIARGIARLRDPSRFSAWSLRIVHNQSADWIRARAKIRNIQSRQLNNPTETLSTDHHWSEDSEQVRIAVSTLDPKLREVVYLFYMDQCTIEQIAIVLNIPQGTAKTRLARARSILKSQLERSTA